MPQIVRVGDDKLPIRRLDFPAEIHRPQQAELAAGFGQHLAVVAVLALDEFTLHVRDAVQARQQLVRGRFILRPGKPREQAQDKKGTRCNSAHNQSSCGGGASTSRWPLLPMALTTPEASMVSISRAARL